MAEYNTDWNRRDLAAYIMLYFANADFVETDEEKKIIKAKVGRKEYQHIHKEFDEDNDYASIQKITRSAEKLDIGKDKMESLLKEIKDLFEGGDDSDIMEENLFRGLKRLFD